MKMSHPFVRFGKNIVEQYAEFVQSCRPVDEAFDVAALIGFPQDSDHCDIWTAFFFQDLSAQGIRATVDSLSKLLPAGLNVVGFLQVSSEVDAVPDENTIEQCPCFELLNLVDSIPLRIVAVCAKERLISSEIERIFCYAYSEDGGRIVHCYFNPICWASAEELSLKTLSVFVDIQLTLKIILKTPENKDNFSKMLAEKFRSLESEFDGDRLYYQTSDKASLIGACEKNGDVCIMGKCQSDMSCFDLWNILSAEQELDRRKKKKELCFATDRITLKLLQKVADCEANDELSNCVPVVSCEKGDFKQVSVPVKLKCVAIVSQDKLLVGLGAVLKSAILRQLASVEESIRHHSNINDLNVIGTQPYLFLPGSIPHFIIVHYPSSLDDTELEKFRHSFHTILNLPLGVPLLRRTNRFLFPADYGPYLRNVHTFVARSGVEGKVSMVRGDYQYHHYMQDGFNDQGWGCAYRSFQTVWSWFLLQGYTHKPVPTHRDIQEVLVAIGDKEASFVGSKQWVGSLELSYCLNQMLDVTSRIATAASGDEMSCKARELAYHFDTQATPVMIGGGVLAHTILGVDFNENTGEVKFLVLDPHYTGDENVKTIIDKGWCGWKPTTFWGGSFFYNMLLPQRPHVI